MYLWVREEVLRARSVFYEPENYHEPAARTKQCFRKPGSLTESEGAAESAKNGILIE